jgi:hypothetical protein
MGYDLTMKIKLEGVKNTKLEGVELEIKLNELCDDGSDPSKCKLSSD